VAIKAFFCQNIPVKTPFKNCCIQRVSLRSLVSVLSRLQMKEGAIDTVDDR